MTFRLTDLPVEPNHDEMTCSYMSQVKQVNSVEALKAHVDKWKALWNLDVPPGMKVTQEELNLANGTFDAEAAFACVKRCYEPDGHCGHTSPSCYGMHIVLPPVLLFAHLIGKEYGVPTDIAVIQMCGGYGALER